MDESRIVAARATSPKSTSETHDSEPTKPRKRTAGSAMSTSGSSIADEVELPGDLSGSVDIEHDVVVSGDVDASEGTAEMGTGEAAAEETASDEGPMRPDLIVGPPPEPELPIDDDTSVGDRSSEEEAYSDEFYEEDAVPEKEEPEPPVAETSVSQGPPGGDATATRDDTYGDDFEEYGGGDEDGDDEDERSTPSPLARDPPTSPASQPLRSLGTPGSSPDDSRSPRDRHPSPSPTPRDVSGRAVDATTAVADATTNDDDDDDDEDYSWRLPARSAVALLAARRGVIEVWRPRDPQGATPKVVSSLMRRARAIADRRDRRKRALARGVSELEEDAAARRGSGPVVLSAAAMARLETERTKARAAEEARAAEAREAAMRAAQLAELTPERRRTLYLAKVLRRVRDTATGDVGYAAGSPRLEFGLGVARGAGDRGSGVMVASPGGVRAGEGQRRG